jgi:bifunctional non-homologous end joining protein LigD
MTGAAPLGLDSGNAASIFVPMSISNELRRRLRAEQSRPRFEPCLPRPAKEPPAGLGWIHEIKHDGFRILARRDQGGVRLLTRNGNDFTEHFPHIAEAIRALNVRSCVIDGEAIVTDDKGLAVFELIRGHGTRRGAELCAFDLIELDGKDIRHTPIEERKRHLGKLLGRYQPGIVVNEFFEGDAQIIFDHVCKLGCEGIVSKRLGSRYRGGRSADWVKVKNPATGGTAAR